MAHTGALVTLDPTSGPLDRKDPRKLPERPDTLNGAVVGFVVNGLGKADALMDALYEELSNHAELAGRVKILKDDVSIPPRKEDFAKIVSESTVAVTGFGG